MKPSMYLHVRKIIRNFFSQLDTYLLSKILSRKTCILQNKGFLMTNFAMYVFCSSGWHSLQCFHYTYFPISGFDLSFVFKEA